MAKHGRGEICALREGERDLPKVAVEIQDEAGLRRAEFFDLLQCALHIPQVIDGV